MAQRNPNIESETDEPVQARPSDPQEQSPFFKLPWELRMAIYNSAYPRIHLPQLIYTDVDGRASCNEIGHGFPANSRLCRAVCNGVCEDKGVEIRSSRAMSSMGRGSKQNQNQHRYCRSHDGLVYPMPLLLACRRMYEDVAPHCDQSLAFQDFLGLEAFFDKVSGRALANGLLDRLNKVSLDVKFSNNDAFRPSSRKKILARWTAVCKILATWKNMQCFRLQIEIPLSQKNSMPGNIHVPIVNELGPVAIHTPDIKVTMMLTSRAHPRSEATRVYEPGASEYHLWDYGFEVPGWKTRKIRGKGLDDLLGIAQ